MGDLSKLVAPAAAAPAALRALMDVHSCVAALELWEGGDPAQLPRCPVMRVRLPAAPSPSRLSGQALV